MDNLEKLATLSTQDEYKQKKNTTQLCWKPLYASKHNNVNKT